MSNSQSEADTIIIIFMILGTIAIVGGIPYFVISGIEHYEDIDHQEYIEVTKYESEIVITVKENSELEYVEVFGDSPIQCNNELSEGCLLLEEDSANFEKSEDIQISIRTKESMYLVYDKGEFRDLSAKQTEQDN